MLENHQIGDCPNEPGLADLLLEAQKENDAVIARHVDLTTEVATQVALLLTAEPAHLAFAVRGNAFVQAVENGSLIFLDQK